MKKKAICKHILIILFLDHLIQYMKDHSWYYILNSLSITKKDCRLSACGERQLLFFLFLIHSVFQWSQPCKVFIEEQKWRQFLLRKKNCIVTFFLCVSDNFRLSIELPKNLTYDLLNFCVKIVVKMTCQTAIFVFDNVNLCVLNWLQFFHYLFFLCMSLIIS